MKTKSSAPVIPEPAGAVSADRRQVRQRTSIVRRAVIDAAAALFAERGFSGTNLQDVADALGMSRPGLYYHFASKDKLLEAIVEEVTIHTERQLREIAEQVDREPVEALRAAILTNGRWTLTHGTLFRVLDRAEAELPEDLRMRHHEAKRAILDNMTAIIERGIRIGQFRPVDPSVAAFAIVGMCNWSAWWFKPDGRSTIEDVVESFAEFATRMLLRLDVHRSRSERVDDAVRVLKEDIAHLELLIRG